MLSLAFFGLFNFLVAIFLGLLVLLRNYQNPQNRGYAYFHAAIALYSLGYCFCEFSKTPAAGLFWFKILSLGVIFIAPTYLHFIFALIDYSEKKKKQLIFFYLLGVVLTVCNFSSLLYTGVEERFGLGYGPIITPLFHFYIFSWFAQLAYGHMLLLLKWRVTTGIKREQVKFFALATLLGFAFGSTTWLMWYKINFYPLTVLVSVYAVFTAYAMLRLRFLNITVLTIRAVFLLLYALMLLTPLFIGHMLNNWIFATVLAIVIGSAGQAGYRWLVAQAESRFFINQRRYQKMIKNIAYEVLQYHETKRLLHYIVHMCTTTAELKSAYLFLQQRGNDNVFYVAASKNKEKTVKTGELGIDHPIIKALNDSDNVNIEAILIENVGGKSELYRKNLREFSEKYGVSIVFALREKDRLIGLLALGPKQNGNIFTKDDIESFSMLAYQSALAIESCRYLDEIKDLYEKSVIDKLTGCYNRLFYEEYLDRAIKRSSENNTSFFLAMLDINYFKHLNDSYGHDAGDQVLSMLGSTLKKSFREEDVVVRYGGDEFSVILDNISRKECEEIMKRLVSNIINTDVVVKKGDGEISIKFSISAGVAKLKIGESREELFRRSDNALFEAKRAALPYYFSE